LCQPVADFLRDNLSLILSDIGQLRRRPQLDRLHRHRLVKAQTTVIERAGRSRLVPLVADLLFFCGAGRCYKRIAAETRQKIRLHGGVDDQALLRALAKELALEPLELRSQCLQLVFAIAQSGPKGGVLSAKSRDIGGLETHGWR